jgi:hypothetical protein
MNIDHTLFFVFILIAIILIAYKVNFNGKVKSDEVERVFANARYGANRDKYLDKLSDNHWGPKIRKIKHLDTEDQMDLFAGVVHWIDISKTGYLDYNDIASYVRCEHGQLIDVLHHVAAQVAKLKLTPEQFDSLDACTIYNMLLSYKA